MRVKAPLILAILLLCLPLTAHAQGGRPILTVRDYAVTPTPVKPGQEFTVGASVIPSVNTDSVRLELVLPSGFEVEGDAESTADPTARLTVDQTMQISRD